MVEALAQKVGSKTEGWREEGGTSKSLATIPIPSCYVHKSVGESRTTGEFRSAQVYWEPRR